MDYSREHELSVLHKRMHDTELPLPSRKVAYRSFNRILEKMKDKPLTTLRHRLIRAHEANDKDAADKIEMEIKAYVYKKYGEVS